VKEHRIKKDALVMLNITGGGELRFMCGRELFYLKPSLVFDMNPNPDEVVRKIKPLFKH